MLIARTTRKRKGGSKSYRWEVGTHLANEVRARDAEAAAKSLGDILSMIADGRGREHLDEVKLRMVQVLSIANRAAYDAGANCHRIFPINIAAIGKLMRAESVAQVAAVSRKTIRRLISLVPDRDYSAQSKVDLALRYIREHSIENISREAVAEFAGCSPSHLSHILSQLTGQTFKEHVLRQRMEIAKALLRKTTTRIIDVAFEVGYDDHSSFSYAFKKVTGVTPLQYRRRIASPHA